MNESTSLYCGIDVSCDTLDICYQTSEKTLQHAKLPNTVKGFAQLLKLTGPALSFCDGGNRCLPYQPDVLSVRASLHL